MTTFIVGGTKKTLRMDDRNGIDHSADFIGNTAHGMTIDSEGNYIASADDFAWWERVISEYMAMDEQIAEYTDKYGYDAVDSWLETTHAYDSDLEDMPSRVSAALADLKDAT